MKKNPLAHGRRSGQRSHKTDWEGATSERRVDPSAQACEPDEGGHQVEPEEERRVGHSIHRGDTGHQGT